MSVEYYHTIRKKGEGIYREKGSKFLGFAFPVDSEEEIRDRLESLKKNYHDARHHCYAWRIGAEMQQYRVNDDGEPSNSAGKPIFGQIQSRELTNVLVVVVRYFGGTLLGVGGLINAYRSAASEALEEAGIVKKYVRQLFRVNFDYKDTNVVMKILGNLHAEQSEQDFTQRCSLTAKVKKRDGEAFLAAFKPFPEINLQYLGEE